MAITHNYSGYRLEETDCLDAIAIEGGESRGPVPEKERTPAVILQFDRLPATSQNVERIRRQVGLLNRRLAESGVPFQLRVI